MLGGWLAGCQGTGQAPPSPESETSPGPLEPPAVHAAEELRGSYRNPALAFSMARGRYTAGFSTHRVDVAHGAMEFTPKRVSGVAGMPIRFETRGIQRGRSAIATAPGAVSPSNSAELTIQRGPVVEQIENREEGVEQRWQFNGVPSGVGDLEVSVAVSGFDRVETSNSGLHFFAGGLGLRYSHARWIDSKGGAWDVPSEWTGDAIIVRVPDHVLASTVWPATLDPTVEAEEAVDDPVLGNSGANALAPSIASRGDGFLVVWGDQRVSSNTDIFAARVNASGAILDASGLLVNAGAGKQTTPVATRVGATWVVAWNDGGNISAATVTDDAAVAQLGPVAATAATEILPAIASNNTNAVLAWQSGNDINAAVYSGSFGSSFSIASAATEVDPAVAASPTGYLVAWNDETSVKAQLLTSSGVPTGSVVDVAAGGNQVAVTFNGTDYMLTFTYGNDVYGARVSSAGALVDAMPRVVATGAGLQSESTIACDSASCLVMYSDTRTLSTTGFDVYAQRVNFDFTLAGTEITVSNPARYQVTPQVAVGSLGWLGVWEDQRTGGSSLAVGARITGGGAVQDLDGIVLNTSQSAEFDAATASAPGSTQVVVWSDSRSLGNDIEAVRYSSVGGGRLDSPAKTVSSASNDQATPAVSFDGTQFLAVWSDARGVDRDIYASRFGTDGSTMEPNGIPVTTAVGIQGAPDVASGGGVSLAVWADRRNGTFDIYGAIITPAGTVSVADIAVSVAANDQNAPAVVFDPNSGNFIVVWSDKRTLGVGDIFGARISPAGVVLDPSGVQIAGSQQAQVQPDIAVSGTVVMVVWDDRRTDSTGDIVGSRVSAANNTLSVLDPSGIPISYIPPGRQNAPAIVGMPNSTFLVAWVDSRDVQTTGTDVYGVSLNSAGQPLDSTGFAIAATAGDQGAPAFQSDPNTSTRVALVYQSYRSDVGATRTFRRLITVDGGGGGGGGGGGAPNGTICQSDSQCGSGFCIDAMCCNSQCGGNFNQSDCQTCNRIYGGTVDGQCTIIVVEAICRNFAGPLPGCDLREYCDGVNPQCPEDIGYNQGGACTTSSGASGTCGPEAAPGPHVCQ